MLSMMKCLKYLPVICVLQMSLSILLADVPFNASEESFSGIYEVQKTKIDGYPANHSDFLHIRKWKRGTPLTLKLKGTNALEVIYHTKYGTLQTNVLSITNGFSLTLTNGKLEISRVVKKAGYMLPGKVTVERRIILKTTEVGLFVVSSYQELGRSIGLIPWSDPIDSLSIHLARKVGEISSWGQPAHCVSLTNSTPKITGNIQP